MANFDAIVDIQNEIISQVCSGVDDQLGELVSGEEGEWIVGCSHVSPFSITWEQLRLHRQGDI